MTSIGWDVLVVGAQDGLGGAVRGDESVAPGFTSDVFSACTKLRNVAEALGTHVTYVHRSLS